MTIETKTKLIYNPRGGGYKQDGPSPRVCASNVHQTCRSGGGVYICTLVAAMVIWRRQPPCSAGDNTAAPNSPGRDALPPAGTLCLLPSPVSSIDRSPAYTHTAQRSTR